MTGFSNDDLTSGLGQMCGWVYATPYQYNYGGEPRLAVQFFETMRDEAKPSESLVAQGYVPISYNEFYVTVPEGWDLVKGQVECLMAKRAKLEREHTNALTEISDALAKLICLEHETPVAAAAPSGIYPPTGDPDDIPF